MGKEWDRLLKAPSGSAHARQHSVSFVNPGNPTCRNCGGLKSLESEGSGGRIKCRCDDPDFPNHLLPRARAMQEWHQAWATEALRVLKPGGHLLAFGGTRTYHRLVCAVEDAGFEIRDTISWLYASGFPKSLDVGKAIDKRGGANIGWFGPWLREERERRGLSARALCAAIGEHGAVNHGGAVVNWEQGHNLPTVDQFNKICGALKLPFDRLEEAEREVTGRNTRPAGWFTAQDGHDVTAPATPEAERWEGWGTALKPAHEPVVVARKPLSGTVAGNVLEHGTGALNVDGCRVDSDGPHGTRGRAKFDGFPGDSGQVYGDYENTKSPENPAGRWPANVVLSHSEGCVQVGTRKVGGGDRRKATGDAPKLDPAKGWNANSITRGGQNAPENYGTETVGAWSCTSGCPVRLLDEQTGELTTPGANTSRGELGEGWGFDGHRQPVTLYGDSGGASRFFYVAKASRGERNSGLEGFEEQPAGGHVRSQDEGTYWEFVHPAPEGIGEWLRDQREAAGLSRKGVAQHFPSRTGGLTGCVTNWEEEFNRPTPDQWRKLREVLRFDDRYDVVMTEQREVVRELFDDKPRQTARNVHPTVKPISLMRWLVRLVTPPNGVVLDPFTGSGTTGIASVLEGFDFIGLEREPEYVAIAGARIAWWHKHRGDGEAAQILAAGEARDEVEATGQLGMFD